MFYFVIYTLYVVDCESSGGEETELEKKNITWIENGLYDPQPLVNLLFTERNQRKLVKTNIIWLDYPVVYKYLPPTLPFLPSRTLEARESISIGPFL